MRPEDLVFWLDRLDGASSDGGVLCLRHADTMIVPGSWTLDDLRDPDLHLFRPPAAQPPAPRARRSSTSASGVGDDADVTEQLELGSIGAESNAAETEGASTSGDAASPANGEAWSPSFDDADDLDGLLAAQSPLLARAFRGDDRPRT